jgi:protocatechuate 3,4-dioxygenase beta subunit
MNGKILGYLSLSLVCGAALLAQNWKPSDKAWTDKRAPELTVTGRVVDTSGHPIPDATIMVYHAGVLNGYSTFVLAVIGIVARGPRRTLRGIT